MDPAGAINVLVLTIRAYRCDDLKEYADTIRIIDFNFRTTNPR